MATNRQFESGRVINAVATDPASGGLSGAPCLVGQLPGVLMTNQLASDNSATIDTGGVYNVSVAAVITGTGNSAVAVGDIIYYRTADTPKLNKTTTGVRFGIALKAITSGATATIPVRVG